MNKLHAAGLVDFLQRKTDSQQAHDEKIGQDGQKIDEGKRHAALDVA